MVTHLLADRLTRCCLVVGQCGRQWANVRAKLIYLCVLYCHTLCCVFHYETYIGISPYHTLCSGFHYETCIGISPYHNLCCGFHHQTYIGISPYHTMCCGFHYETYVGISPYHTLWSGLTMRRLSVSAHITIYTLNKISFFKKNPSVLFSCNPRRTMRGFSRSCMVIVLKSSF